MVVRSRSKDSQLSSLSATPDSAVLRTPPPPPFCEEYQNKGLNPQGSAKNIILKDLIHADSCLTWNRTPPTGPRWCPERSGGGAAPSAAPTFSQPQNRTTFVLRIRAALSAAGVRGLP